MRMDNQQVIKRSKERKRSELELPYLPHEEREKVML
jgi:hypothetical protein